MKKVLIVSSVASMIAQFNKDNIEILQNMGYKVQVATNFSEPGTISLEKAKLLKDELEANDVECFQINFSRNILSIISVYRAFKELSKLKKENEYKFVHCHSPIGGVITRLVFKNSECDVIYTAHGFQFFKNGPKKDWVLFYPIEKILSKYTDILLTINETDYEIAKKKFKQKNIIKIPGVGIKKPKNYTEKDFLDIRRKYNIPVEGILLCSVGELSDRKNHRTVIEAIAKLNNPSIYYLICGRGLERENLLKLIEEKNLNKKVQLIGYVEDIQKVLYASDISVFPSKREGLGLAGLEALSVGTPLISSNVQGIPDYSKNEITGYVSENNSVDEYVELIDKLVNNEYERKEMGKRGIEISTSYLQENVNGIMKKIYQNVGVKK